MDVFLLHCSVSANVRQSTQIKFDDLKLPQAVIDTLESQQAVSIRPNLSGKLKEYLNRLRCEQRKLYDECTIHRGDVHFLHADYFDVAMERIEAIRREAKVYNKELKGLWTEEFERWSTTVDGFLEPLFKDELELKMAREAYLRLFPTKEQFEAPIEVFVIGPNPISLEVSESADDHSVNSRITKAAALNTAEVLQAAQQSAADRALEKAAELMDDLDVRISSKIGDRQTGSPKRRGSWQITATQLQLISRHCPGFENLTTLAEKLVEVGRQMNAPLVKDKDKAFQLYTDTKVEIRKELEAIVQRRDSTEGLATLQKSLALSGTYKDLISQIQAADTEKQLEALEAQITTETDIYTQRSKHLQKLYNQRVELVKASSVSLEDAIEEVKALHAEIPEDCDF
jgi:hypothetical protein